MGTVPSGHDSLSCLMYEVFDFDDFLADPVGKVTGLVCVFYLKKEKEKKESHIHITFLHDL